MGGPHCMTPRTMGTPPSLGQLLQARANPMAVNTGGKTALQLAEQRGHKDVVRRLRQVHSS